MSALFRRIGPLFTFLAVFAFATHANAAKYELKVPTLVKGDKGFSPVDGFELASAQPGGKSSRRRGAPTVSGFSITRNLDWRSPKFFASHLKGKVFPKVVLRVKDGGDVTFTIELKNARIAEVQHKTNAKTGKTKESVVFVFEEIKWFAVGPKGKVSEAWRFEEPQT